MAKAVTVREQAEPHSASQQRRHDRILEAAAALGSRFGYDQVQMVDIAREAGVAIATVYRYFPSKGHLNTRLLRTRVEATRMGFLPPAVPPEDPALAVSETLMGWAGNMLNEESPLGRSMLLGIVSGDGSAEDIEVIDDLFHTMVLEAAGIRRRDGEAATVARLIMRCWYGTFLTMMNGGISFEQGRTELRLACDLLLAPLLGEDS